MEEEEVEGYVYPNVLCWANFHVLSDEDIVTVVEDLPDEGL